MSWHQSGTPTFSDGDIVICEKAHPNCYGGPYWNPIMDDWIGHPLRVAPPKKADRDMHLNSEDGQPQSFLVVCERVDGKPASNGRQTLNFRQEWLRACVVA